MNRGEKARDVVTNTGGRPEEFKVLKFPRKCLIVLTKKRK
jgi:hypothetical protein